MQPTSAAPKKNRALLIIAGLVTVSSAFIGGAVWLIKPSSPVQPSVSSSPTVKKLNIKTSSLSPIELTKLKDSLKSAESLPPLDWDNAGAPDITITPPNDDADLTILSPSSPRRDFAQGGLVLSPGFSAGLKFQTELARQNADALRAAIAKSYTVAKSNPTWTYLALGDIIPARDVYTISRRSGFTYPYLKIADRARQADLTVSNLETTVADGQTYGEGAGMMRFTAPAKAIDGLTLAGIDGVNLANNHAMNGGASGVNSMLELLDSQKIGHFGVAKTGTANTWTATVKGMKIVHLSYNSVPGNIEPTATAPGATRINLKPWGGLTDASIAKIQADIKNAKQSADVVIPWFHWGTEYTHAANDEQRRLAKACVDAGAEVVIGTHPHWTQGIEWYNGHPIAYSLGNFVFDQNWSEKTKQSFALSLTFSGAHVTSARLEPAVIQNQVQPLWLTPSEALYGSILRDVETNSWLP